MVTVPADASPGEFIGREREIGDLRLIASRHRLVTLCGAGGVGKTRLLQALVAALAGDYPDGACLVRLADLGQPDLVLDRMAAALKISPEPGVALADTMTEALRSRRMVLAIDGFEQVPQACASLCERLLACSPGLLVVTAARRPLRVPGEAIWQVPALGLPAAGEDGPAAAAQSDAVALFASRAAAAAPGFALNAGSVAAAAAICRALGGLPLAVELAAARVRDTSVDALAAELAGQPELPGPAEHAVPASYAATMEAALRWTWSALSPAAQVLLRRLSASAGWTLEMAEQVCADDELPAAAIPRLLTSLAEQALLQPRKGSPGQGRCQIPGPVADYAAARCAEAGETELLGRRLRDYTTQRVQYLVSIGHSSVPVTAPVILDMFRSYNDDARNVRTALTWCLRHGDIEGGLRICTRFTICWHMAEASHEGAWWLDALLGEPAPLSGAALASPPAGSAAAGARAQGVPAVARGPALAARAQLGFSGGSYEEALAWGAMALEACQATRDRYFSAIACCVMSQCYSLTGRAGDALRFAERALELAQDRDPFNEAYALFSESDALAAAGRLAPARDSAAAALSLSLRTDQHFGATLARIRLGRVSRALGDLEAARDYYLAALRSGRHTLGRTETARCLSELGQVMLRLGEAGAARGHFAESLRLSLSCGSRAGMASSLLDFAGLAADEGSPDRAVRLAAAATALSDAAGLPRPDEALRYRDQPSGLGEAEAARLWAAGLELSPRAAAALALDPPAVARAATPQA